MLRAASIIQPRWAMMHQCLAGGDAGRIDTWGSESSRASLGSVAAYSAALLYKYIQPSCPYCNHPGLHARARTCRHARGLRRRSRLRERGRGRLRHCLTPHTHTHTGWAGTSCAAVLRWGEKTQSSSSSDSNSNNSKTKTTTKKEEERATWNQS